MTPEGKADPYPGFATVREATQIHHSALGVKAATRYDDVSAILRDNRFGRAEQRLDPRCSASRERSSTTATPTRAESVSRLLELDPPDHTRLRRLVAKAFTPNTVE